MIKCLGIAASLAAMGLCAGCGGGGSSSGAAVVVPLTTHNRILQVGDSCTYSYSGSFTQGGSPIPVSGTAVHTVVARSGNQLTITHDLTFLINGSVFPVEERYTDLQNADGSLMELSDNLGANQSTRTVKSTTFPSVGVWKYPLSLSGVTVFSDGTTEKGSLAVQGTTLVQTGVAAFNTWIVKGTSQSSQGNTSSTTDYVVPGLGFWVLRTETSTTSTGSITVTYRLTSTTVPLPLSGY